MPSLNDSLGQDLSGYGAVPEGSGPQVATSLPNQMPANSGWTRSPLPILSNTSDNLRIFYTGPSTPQTRTLNIQKPPTVVDITAQAMAKTAQAQAQAATETAKAASRTATGAGFTTGSNSNGSWQKNPINQITQFNTLAIPAGITTINFPTNFATSNTNVQVTAVSSGSGSWVNLVTGSVTTTSFQVEAVNSMTISWSATGF
jgi:hypothetical protein